MNRALPIPREHGAYVVLTASWAVGMLYAPVISWSRSLLSLALLFFTFTLPEVFKALARESKKRTVTPGVYQTSVLLVTGFVATSIAAISIAPKLFVIAPIGASIVGLVLFARSRKVSLSSLSVIAFAGLALAAPATAILNGVSDWYLLALSWLLCSAFFCGSNMNVAIRLGNHDSVRRALYYHFFAIPVWVLIAYNFTGFLPGLIALFANLSRLILIVRSEDLFRRTTLKRIGMEEFALSVFFLSVNLLMLI